jgi:uncharacterized protein YjdB
MAKLNKHTLYLTEGTASKYNGKEKVKVTEIPLMNSCDCTIDCCNGMLILKNYDSTTGDSVPIAMYFVDGAPVYSTVDAAKVAIKAFKNNPLIAPETVTITNCPTASIAALATVDLGVVILPLNAQQTGTWSSSATGVATVNSSTGLVTGVAAGTAIITFTTTNGEKTATCSVTVA